MFSRYSDARENICNGTIILLSNARQPLKDRLFAETDLKEAQPAQSSSSASGLRTNNRLSHEEVDGAAPSAG